MGARGETKMTALNRRLLLVFLAFAMVSCRSLSPVTSYGKETYIVSTTSHGGILENWAEVKASSVNAANDYCAKLGKSMEPVRMETHGARGWVPIEAELTFRCVSEESPGSPKQADAVQ